jgi:hypothetical protein
MSDIFLRNTNLNLDDIFESSADNASLPQWISVVDRNDTVQHHAVAGAQANTASLAELLTESAGDTDKIMNVAHNAMNTASVVDSLNSEQLEQKLKALFERAERDVKMQTGGDEFSVTDSMDLDNVPSPVDSQDGGKRRKAAPKKKSRKKASKKKSRKKVSKKKSRKRKYKLKRVSKKKASKKKASKKKASKKKSKKKAPKKKASKKKSRKRKSLKRAPSKKKSKRKLPAALLAFIKLKAHVSAGSDAKGPAAAKLAAKVRNDLLRERPELEQDKIKLSQDAMKYFDDNKSLYT